ncbi:MAG: hypothetical protein AAF753_06700 [Pseudomonadota bacterium]
MGDRMAGWRDGARLDVVHGGRLGALLAMKEGTGAVLCHDGHGSFGGPLPGITTQERCLATAAAPIVAI